MAGKQKETLESLAALNILNVSCLGVLFSSSLFHKLSFLSLLLMDASCFITHTMV